MAINGKSKFVKILGIIFRSIQNQSSDILELPCKKPVKAKLMGVGGRGVHFHLGGGEQRLQSILGERI